MITLETERLILRQSVEADFDLFANFFADPLSARYVGGTKPKEVAWRLMASYLGHWQLKGFGYFSVIEKSTGSFIGCCGLWHSIDWPEIELGYWFLKSAQGKGFANEAATKVKQFAFETIQTKTLVSYIDPDNAKSIKLAERLGAVYDKTIDLSSLGPHLVYRYTN